MTKYIPNMSTDKGMVLVLLILIIVLVVIVVAGLTGFVFESLKLSVFKEQELKTVYLAQAGVMDAIVDYRDGNAWTKKTDINVTGNQYYHVGRDANFLWVDASNPQISAKKLRQIPIQNINDSSSVTITDMTVSWTFGGTIEEVKLGDTEVWEGTASSPASLNITDLTVTSGTSYTGNDDQEWEFSNNVSGDVVCTFGFSDGSQRKAILLNNGSGVNKEFSITATGQVNGNATWRRTIEATYDTGTSTITSWQESSGHIIP